ncbi:unnamed protein product [Adineta ricciae]|uniref:Uncharacterized protein n=1 Tax=Adineta ricciae TaxID=249248 RepID=A0A815K173_ADIRI|nr:unnamed protein product [Adineta ricciae]CAF1389526.1 unnamed protein product [Adineta ricciae]
MKSLNHRSLFVLFITSKTLHAIRIGSIANATFHAWNFTKIYPILTCNECTCTALMLSAAGWNCMIMNKTCQLISNYSSNDIGLKDAINTTFSFQQFPFKQVTTQTAITTQSPLESSCSSARFYANIWTFCTSYYHRFSLYNITLTIRLLTDMNYIWYLDDVSLRTSTSTELITNGNFEGSPPLYRWSTGHPSSCYDQSGLSSTQYHSSNRSYYDACRTNITWISQSLYTSTFYDYYNVSFWIYLDHITSSGNLSNVGVSWNLV